MAGSSNYPGALDDFSAQSPTNLGDDDSTGRTHSERHDDLEAAMEAVQGELGVDPAGASASTVAARFVALDSAVDGKVSASLITASADLFVGAGSGSVAVLASGSAGQVLTVSGSATYGLAWLDAAGGATVEMSDTEPVSPDNGTLWVDTDSDVPTFTASAYVQNSLFANKGTIAAASAASTPAALSVGSNGQMLVANSGASTGLSYINPPAGRNAIINGHFLVNQRGFTSTTVNGTYGFDRWRLIAAGGTVTYSAETFASSAAPLSGAEVLTYARLVSASQSASSDRAVLQNLIEDVRTLSDQVVTISFWAKAASGTPSINVVMLQNFGSGGSAGVDVIASSQAISTSWQRYSFTLTLPSVAGKTIGSSNRLAAQIYVSDGGDYGTGLGAQNNTFDIWGVQLETGPVATPFEFEPFEATLRKCQRYYWVIGGTNLGFPIVQGQASGSGQTFRWPLPFPTTMRSAPTATKNGTWDSNNCGQPSADYITADGFSIAVLSTASANFYTFPNGSDDTITFSAEL